MASPGTRTSLLGSLVVAACGCQVTVSVPNTLTETPAIEPLPVSVGVHYDEAFLANVHEDVKPNIDTWIVPVGQGSKPLLDTCFAGMFEQVTQLDEWAPGDPVPPNLAGVIVPRIERFDFERRPFRAAVGYQLTVHTPRGERCVSRVARGEGENVVDRGSWDVSNRRKASSAVEQAMRAAAAQLVLDFSRDARISSWLARQGVRGSVEHGMFGARPGDRTTRREPRRAVVLIPIPAGRETEGYRSISNAAARRLAWKLGRTIPPHPAIDLDDFCNELFPWFQRSTMPGDASMGMVLRKPAVARRLRELDIGHLILVRGSALDGDFEGPMLAGAGFGAAGALGVSGRDEEAEVTAVVWDATSCRSRRMTGYDSGHSTILGLIAPIPLLARADAHATEELADQLLDYFSAFDDDAPRPRSLGN
jgi:hypothetical protein